MIAIRDIFVNITILISFLFIVGQIFRRYPLEKESPLRVKAIIGLLFGFMGIVLMLFTIKITNDVIVDLRNIAIIGSGVFGGPIGIMFSTIFISIFRVFYFNITKASITAGISTLLIGLGCSLVSIRSKDRKKRYLYMFLMSLVIANLSFIYLLIDSENLIKVLQYHLLSYIVGGALAYYTCEYIVSSNKTFKEMSYYQIMADNLVEMITIHKFNGEYKYASPSSIQLLGKKPNEIVEKNFFDLLHPEDKPRIKKMQEKIKSGKVIESTRELRLKNNEDEYIWVESTFKSITDLEGVNKEIICATRDITGRKRIETKLKMQTAKAIEANKLKSQFLANMSHELRTPLNSIIGFTTRVLKKSGEILPEIQKENLEIVKEEANHLLSLINDLLDYSKIEARKMDVHIESFDLREVIKESLDMTKSIGEEKNVGFKEIIDNNMNMIIKSDRIKLKQIITNLLSNAFKYSEKGTVKLLIENQDNNFRIVVSDEGIGINEYELESIFDEFHQVDGSYTRKVGGTGLGLAITKRFVEMLNGSIKAKSTVGNGSSFSITIPCDYYKKDNIKTLSNLIINEETNKEDNVIAFIEDDFSTKRLYLEYLKDDGFKPIYIDDKQEIKEIIKRVIELNPVVIILDIILKNKDGWEILSELKQNEETKDIPVIISSVLNEQKIAYKLRADDYLVKPVLQDELINSIEKIIEKDDRKRCFKK